MAGEWRETCLGDIAEIVMGQSPPGETCNAEGVGIPLLNGPTEYGPHHPSPVQFTTDARKRAMRGDILFCVRGSTTGRMNWADREYAIGRGVAAVRHRRKPELQPLVRAVIDLGLPELLAQATGSTFPNVAANQLSRIWWPPLEDAEQRAIAHILGTLDDKIELNRRMNETLEAMARSLFKSWFVDFDPVRAKANLPSPAGRGAGGEGPHCSSHTYPPTELRDFARALRNNQTDAEHLMWRMLRDRRIAGAKFRRQHPVPPYVLDFYCHELKLAIELDGGQHGEPTGLDRDRQRDAALSERGITVLRFWNHEVLNETEAVLEQAYRTVMERVSPSPQTPLPEGEGFCGLPKHITDLFPDSFEDSELGEIPKGWEVRQLSEMTTLITKGTTPTQSDTYTDDEADGGINYVRVNAIDEDGAILFDKLTTIPESVHLGALKRSVLQTSDVLYTIAGTIGRTAIVEESLLPANTNQAVAIVRPKQAIPAAFLVMTMRAAAFREELHSNVVQAVQANLSLGVLSRARIVVPPKDTLLQLFVPIADLTTRVSSTRTESRTLAALRDALLPKLISGELRVKQMEPEAA